MRLRTDRAIALAVLVGAFLIRLAFLIQTRKLPFYYHPVLDSGFFDQWAVFKKTAIWSDYTPAFREPLYAYFLAAVYTVFRQSLTAARVVQGLLGGATALLVYAIARRLYGRLAGVAAGIIFAFCAPAIFFSNEINETSLVMFLLTLSAYLLLRAEASWSYVSACGAGLALGASYLARFATIAALPAWVLHLLLARDARLRKASLLVLAGFVILPLAYQVLLVKGQEHALAPLRASWQAFLGSGQVGGTVPEPHYVVPLSGVAGGYSALGAPDGMDGQGDALRLAKIETGETVGFKVAAAHWRTRAFRDFASSPGRYLKTYFTRLGIFWGPSEPPANIDSRYVARHSLLLKNPLFSFAVLAPIGLVGLARRGRTLAGLAIFVLAYSVLASFYLVSDAAKALILPFLAVFGATVVGEVIVGLKNMKASKSVAYLVAAGILGVLLCLLPQRKMDQARELVALGDIYREEAIFDRAESAYDEAIRLSPASPEAYLSLSKIYSTSWKAEQALEVLSRAQGEAEADPRLGIEKASMLLTLSRPDDAARVLDAVAAKYPFEPRLHEAIGLSLLARGDAKAGVVELQKELDYSGGGFVTYAAMGRAELQMGNFEAAATSLENAARLNPSETGVAMQLADAYNRLGQYIKACDVLSRVLAIDPGNMPLRFKFANSLYHAERYTDALKQFTELANFDPKNADFLVNMGAVYAAMDSTNQAIEAWQKALRLDPNNELARQNLKAVRE